MKRITDSTRIVDSREAGHDTYEVCATEVASFDEAQSMLTMCLDCFVRKVIQQSADVVTRPAWLPRQEIIRHHTSRDEAVDEAKEIFEQWTTKVKRSIPPGEEFRASVAGPAERSRR